MARATLAAIALALGALTLSGCLEDKLVPTEPLVVSAPWRAPEVGEYQLLNREDGEEVGRGTLEVEEQDGLYELSQNFTDDEEYDRSSVLVDMETLKPVSGTRDRFVDNEEARLRWEYDAAEEVVTIIEIGGNGEERPVPHRLKSDWYDNDTSLFVWRSLGFVEGLEVTYHSVVTGSGEQPVVQVEVVGKERITVPAGTFDTWRLEIRGQGRNQVAWFADTPAHPLVQYDNSLIFFQLLTEPRN